MSITYESINIPNPESSDEKRRYKELQKATKIKRIKDVKISNACALIT